MMQLHLHFLFTSFLSFMFQHSSTVWCEDTCSGSTESPQHGLWNLQMDWIWWRIFAGKCGICGSAWPQGNGNAVFLFFIYYSSIFIRIIRIRSTGLRYFVQLTWLNFLEMPLTWTNEIMYNQIISASPLFVLYLINFLFNSASWLGELFSLHSHFHPEWGWPQHAHFGGRRGAFCSKSLVAASRWH